MDLKDLNIFKELAVDLDKVDNGTWVNVTPTIRMRLARLDRPEAVAVRTRIREEHKVSLDLMKTMNRHEELEELNRKLLGQTLAESIVKDWEGLTINGEDVPFSQETCENLLCSPQMGELVERILRFSSNWESFRAQEIEAATKN